MTRDRGARLASLLLCLVSAGTMRIAAALDPDRAIAQLPHAWYEERLPQNTVLAIAQRRDGAIWLATYAGLVRYSGGEFETYDKRNAPGLRSTAITALHETRAGDFFVGTLNGGLYRMAPGTTLHTVPLPEPIESVFAIGEDAAGALWLATNAGLARRSGERWEIFDDDDGVPRGPFRALLPDPDGSLWIAVDGRGVLNHRDGHFELLGREHGLPHLSVYGLRFDRDGVLWAATHGGLVRLRNGRFEPEPRAAAIEGKRIFTLVGDRDGGLWLTVQGMGLCRLTRERFECERDVRGLSNDIARSMAEDREGNLWLGTTNSGLHRISDSKLVTVTGNLESNSVRAVYEDASAQLWVATDGGGLARWQDRELVAAPHALPSPFLRALEGDAAGRLWVGAIEGATRIAPDGTLRHFGVGDGMPAAIVFALAPGPDGAMWAGTTTGLARIEGERVGVIDALRGHDVRALRFAPDGRLWIGLRSGLRCLRGNSVDNCGSDGLDNTSVFAFLPDGEGGMWLGTSQGLMRLRGTRLSQFADAAGLAGESIFTVLDDHGGQLWLSSNRGIARIARAELDALDRGELRSVVPQWFGKSDGMLSSQGNGASQSPGWRTRDGRLWIGTARGVVRIDAARLRRNLLPPPVAIERIRVDGRELDASTFDVGADDGGAALRLGPGVNNLEFHYAGMSYVAPEAVRHRYRLQGYDQDWIDAGARRAAYYTNLPPGDYVFRVIAANNDGVWNEDGARLAFEIAPRLSETTWVRIAAGIAAVLVLFALYRLRLWRLRENERELVRKVAAQTEALREANAELRRLASLDGLTRIANRGAFDQSLVWTWNEHRRRPAPFALLLCDIDSFKAYNDNYGHQAGDAALIRVAGALARAARAELDLAARYGGEELALLLAETDRAGAIAIAQRLLEAVRALGIEHRYSGVADHVTVSIGVAVHEPGTDQPVEALVRAADAALYRAKAQGRDRVVAD